MYQTYKLVTEVYYQNTISSKCYSTWLTYSPYDVHLASNNKDSGVPMNISKCFNNSLEVVEKAQR